jgi:uncharacterized membrane protein YgcG
MMSPYAILGLMLLSVLGATILALALSPRRKPVAHLLTDHADERLCPREGYPALGGGKPPARKIGRSPALGAPYGKPKPIFFTPRQIERVNIARTRRGAPPFNRTGLTNAIAHPWDRAAVRQPQTSSDWLAYLIMYEIMSAGHQGRSVSGCGGLTIDPDAPYNGHGGEYAGAGASGDWSNSLIRGEAQAIDNYQVSPASTPTDTVISSAPASDPSPSYSSDSSSSSSSYDSGSSSSDSSGSSGGGGD